MCVCMHFSCNKLTNIQLRFMAKTGSTGRDNIPCGVTTPSDAYLQIRALIRAHCSRKLLQSVVKVKRSGLCGIDTARKFEKTRSEHPVNNNCYPTCRLPTKCYIRITNFRGAWGRRKGIKVKVSFWIFQWAISQWT